MLAWVMLRRMKIFRFAALALTLGGCGGGDPMMMAGPDMAISGCSQQAKADKAYTGDAAGALKLAGPKILAFQPDAQLVTLVGEGIDTKSGETTGGMGSQWIVTFYSAKIKRNFAGVYGGDSGFVSCQDVKPADPLPPVQPTPTSGSADVMGAAVTRLLADAKARNQKPMISASRVNYGLVTLGIMPPREKTWRVDLTPWALLVDDASGSVVDCQNSGDACRK